MSGRYTTQGLLKRCQNRTKKLRTLKNLSPSALIECISRQNVKLDIISTKINPPMPGFTAPSTTLNSLHYRAKKSLGISNYPSCLTEQQLTRTKTCHDEHKHTVTSKLHAVTIHSTLRHKLFVSYPTQPSTEPTQPGIAAHVTSEKH